MRTDPFFDQHRAREVDVGPLRSGTWTREAPTNARRPAFDGLTIGLHWATVLFVLAQFASVASAPCRVRVTAYQDGTRRIWRSAAGPQQHGSRLLQAR